MILGAYFNFKYSMSTTSFAILHFLKIPSINSGQSLQIIIMEENKLTRRIFFESIQAVIVKLVDNSWFMGQK